MHRVLTRALLALAVLGALFASATPADAAPSTAQNDGIEDYFEEYFGDYFGGWFGPNRYEDVIVMLTPGSRLDEFVNSLEDRGGVVSQRYDRVFNGFAASLPGWLVDILEGYPEVITVEPDVEVTIAAAPTGVERIFATDNPNIAIDDVDDFRVDADVAVIDTGIEGSHPDLNVVSSIDCASFGGCGGPSTDYNGHGTHVAGTVGALDNDFGVVGVAPGVRLHNIQVLDSFGRGYLSWVNAGINEAISRGDIDVINLSLGCSCPGSSMDTAVDSAVAAGIVVVGAAGNRGIDAANQRPGGHPLAIGVSALADSDGEPGGSGGSPSCRSHADDVLAVFSNYGPAVDIIAPGVCINSTFVGGSYNAGYSGTSMAAPHVAGAAALLASVRHPANGADVAAIKSTLIANGNYDWIDTSGDGIQEPLLDLSNQAVFAPAMVAGSEAPAGPSASFTHSCTYLSCTFTDTSTPPSGATLTSWSWDFDDGGSTTDSTAQSPNHVFPGSGTYDVELTVTDSNTDAESATVEVDVTANPGPTANFSRSCDYLECSFTDTSTDDGSITRWEWDFENDGAADTTITSPPGDTSHTYSAGPHTVELTVTDDGTPTANTNSKTESFTLVANTAPSADFSASCVYLTCTFTDGSTDDSDGGVVGWSWNFGDSNTSTQQNPVHTYAADGSKVVTLTVTDTKGLTNGKTGAASPTNPPPNIPPDPDFTFSCDHLECDFTDASDDSDGHITSRTWDFDTTAASADSTATNPSHTYPGTDTYDVKLTVVDNEGESASITKAVAATANPKPAANFSAACTDLNCNFTDLSVDDADGAIVGWSWDFGDGGSTVDSTARNPSHAYSSGATRLVTLTVTDDDGDSSSFSANVTSTNPPVPPISLSASRSGFWVPTVTLNWTGVIPGSVDVYRNGSLHATTNNDGSQSYANGFLNFTRYTWQVCHAGTSVCSATVNQ